MSQFLDLHIHSSRVLSDRGKSCILSPNDSFLILRPRARLFVRRFHVMTIQEGWNDSSFMLSGSHLISLISPKLRNSYPFPILRFSPHYFPFFSSFNSSISEIYLIHWWFNWRRRCHFWFTPLPHFGSFATQMHNYERFIRNSASVVNYSRSYSQLHKLMNRSCQFSGGISETVFSWIEVDAVSSDWLG